MLTWKQLRKALQIYSGKEVNYSMKIVADQEIQGAMTGERDNWTKTQIEEYTDDKQALIQHR